MLIRIGAKVSRLSLNELPQNWNTDPTFVSSKYGVSLEYNIKSIRRQGKSHPPSLYPCTVAMDSELTLPTPTLPVVFRGTDGTVMTFNRLPDGQGGEGYVWREGNEAWKIFTNDNTFATKSRDYAAARAAGLPMGGEPRLPTLTRGSVTQGTDRPRNGFAIVSRWLEGTRFFGKTDGSLTNALRAQAISHRRSDPTYVKIRRACNTANALPLTDAQGYIDGRVTAADPAAFLDIHIGTPSGAAQLVREIDAWGTQP